MKVRVTERWVRQNYKVIALGYCVGHKVLERFYEAYYYTAGVFGWNADIYAFGPIAIATGYRPFGKHCEKAEAVVEKFAKEIRRREKTAVLSEIAIFKLRQRFEKALREAIA